MAKYHGAGRRAWPCTGPGCRSCKREAEAKAAEAAEPSYLTHAYQAPVTQVASNVLVVRPDSVQAFVDAVNAAEQERCLVDPQLLTDADCRAFADALADYVAAYAPDNRRAADEAEELFAYIARSNPAEVSF